MTNVLYLHQFVLPATGGDHFECRECYGAAIGGAVIIVMMVAIGICCCLSLANNCSISCCCQSKHSFTQYAWTMEIHRLKL